MVHENVNAAKRVDRLMGIVPIVNLERIQKIHRDAEKRLATIALLIADLSVNEL